MKTRTYFLAFSLFLLTLSEVFACDICGCGAGNFYLGIMPQINKNFIGLRYRVSNFRSHVGWGERFETAEKFQTAELFARLYPAKNVQIIAFLPYQFHEQQEYAATKKLSGIGDASLTASYRLIAQDSGKVRHQLFAGAGVKLPTGKFRYEGNSSSVANPNFQTGTGSWDFILTGNYTLRTENVGISTDLSYKINGKNADLYRFGNRLSGNINFFRVTKSRKIAFMPYAGAYFEHSEYDVSRGEKNENTGGSLMSLNLGADFYFGRISLGINGQLPLMQNLARGQIMAGNRLNLQALVLF